MIILAGFFTLSFIASSFVIAACAISSRISSDQALEEAYDYIPEMNWETASQSAS